MKPASRSQHLWNQKDVGGFLVWEELNEERHHGNMAAGA
jgi:hypothetical protein